jgi:putative FmdB family regulatory protein
MPIYEYECRSCGDRHEFIQKFSDAPKRKCPACGASRLKRLVSAAAFHLKGGGWYVTDFRDKDKKKADGKADTGGKNGKDGKDSKDGRDSKDSKDSKDGRDSKDTKSPGKDGAKSGAGKSADTSAKSSDTPKTTSDKKSAD